MRQENHDFIKFCSSFPTARSISFVATLALWPKTLVTNGFMNTMHKIGCPDE